MAAPTKRLAATRTPAHQTRRANTTFRIAGHVATTTSVSIRGHAFRLIRPVDPAGLCDDPEVQLRFDADEYMPYWAELWPAALLLSGYLLDHPCGNAVQTLEIGCGLGLVALVAAEAGGRVLATDYAVVAIQCAARSADLNAARRLRTAVMDWRQPAVGRRFDRILAADVLYERRWHAPIARLAADCLVPGGEALICDPGRDIAVGFEDQVRLAGLTTAAEALTGHDEFGKAIRGVLYRIGRV